MAYIGRGTDKISNVEVLDNITFNGASSYTLQKGGANFVPVSANNILLSIDGVVQANNFSVSGSTIDFGTAVTGTCNFVLHFGTGLITTVQDGAVTTAKIGDDAVTYAKLQNLATANRVLGSTSTGLIGETQIATAMVSDDAITYAKMQDTSAANRVLGAVSAGTVGEVQVATDMIADAQVDESKLKISNAPTNGYFLSAQSGNTGGLTWAEAGGTYVKIAEADYSSAVSEVVYTDCFTSTYSIYKMYFYNIYNAANNAELQVRLLDSSANALGNHQKVSLETYIELSGSGKGTASQGDSGLGYIRLAHNDLDSISDQPSALEMTFYQPYESTYTIIDFRYHLRSDNNYLYNYVGTSFLKNTTSVRSLKIGNESSVNFAGYKSVIYGIKR